MYVLTTPWGSSPLTRGAPDLRSCCHRSAGLIPAHAGSTVSWSLFMISPSAHPRSRGEHKVPAALHRVAAGSSPLTRGARAAPGPRNEVLGLIPAHAGSTSSPWEPGPGRSAHPRSRGEHRVAERGKSRLPGSSPLTRGAPRGRAGKVPAARLIPAHAGSTTPAPANPSGGPAHPRSRGEHIRTQDARARVIGSSPLTRGARVVAPTMSKGKRLIPAHAGSTQHTAQSANTTAAHPRSRGEHVTPEVIAALGGGSSPLTRGALTHRRNKLPQLRLIPAHAGSTASWRFQARAISAHPRSRGEHVDWCVGLAAQAGSSPLMRGAPARPLRRLRLPRLIPAHAGSTQRFRPAIGGGAAHPRSRGEHRGGEIVGIINVGSSPLTRGARRGKPDRRAAQGLIPAHAGSTGPHIMNIDITRAHPRSRGEHSMLGRAGGPG